MASQWVRLSRSALECTKQRMPQNNSSTAFWRQASSRPSTSQRFPGEFFSGQPSHRLVADDARSCTAQAVYYQGTVVQSKVATVRGAAGIRFDPQDDPSTGAAFWSSQSDPSGGGGWSVTLLPAVVICRNSAIP